MKLSICIPNRNDTVMLAVTLRSCLDAISGCSFDSEIIVVDNSDYDIWKLLKTPNKSPLPLVYVQEGLIKLIRQEQPSLYTARQQAIDAARGEYIINIDSHTLIGRNTFSDCVAFMDSNPQTGFGFFPCNFLTRHVACALHDIKPNARGGIFGNWGRLYDKPTKICWGFGWRISRKDWYETINGYSFYADKMLSWGGGEFYIAIKSWLMGKANWAIPTDPVCHMGPYSAELIKLTGHRYLNYNKSGSSPWGLGILAAFYALGGDSAYKEAETTDPDISKRHGITTASHWEAAKELAMEDREWIEQRQMISFSDLLKEKPWMEGWSEDRWTSWQPAKQLKRTFNLNRL